jgi:hypothetical protein
MHVPTQAKQAKLAGQPPLVSLASEDKHLSEGKSRVGQLEGSIAGTPRLEALSLPPSEHPDSTGNPVDPDVPLPQTSR